MQRNVEDTLKHPHLAKRGILLLSSRKNEWILPWWKINYLIKNTLPVAIADVGLSEKAKKWCQSVATVIPIQSEKTWPGLTLKEVALTHTPFEETLYLEPYMQVRTNLSDLFSHLSENISLIVTKNEATWSHELLLYRKEREVLSWILKEISDENIEHKTQFLSSFYNWPFEESGDNLFAQVVNRKGKASEMALREQMVFFQEKLHMKLGMFL